MIDNTAPGKQRNYLWTWRVFLTLAILQSVLAIAVMLLSQSSSGTALLLGLSGSRLVLVLIVAFATCLFLWLFIETWLAPDKVTKRSKQIITRLNQPATWTSIALVLGTVFITGSYFITLTPAVSEPFTEAYFIRLLPFVIWITGINAQTLIALLWIRYGDKQANLLPKGSAFYITLLVIGAIFLGWSTAASAVIPIERANSGLNNLGAPVIGIQLLLAWVAGMGFLLFSASLSKDRQNWAGIKDLKPGKFDVIIFILLWVLTAILWQSMPLSSNWFLSEPMAPNHEFYPTSDARVYDISSQLALIGEGFQFYYSPYVRRPLHTLYLTLLHMAGGQDYETVAFLQVLILSLLPPFIYLLTKSLHNRMSGVIAGVLILLREANSISIGGNVTVSHAKLYMVDLPMALLVVIFMYLVIKWLKGLEKDYLLGLICGGFLGLAMLIRLETFVFFFPLLVILAILLFPKKRYALWAKQIILFILGITLVVSPWVFRNWQKTGLVYIDSPVFYYGLIAVRYQPVPTEAPPSPSEEELDVSPIANPTLAPTADVENEPLPTPFPIDEEELTSELSDPIREAANRSIEFIKANSKQIVGFISTHYLNSQVQPFLVLPTSYRGMDSLIGFIGHKSPETLWDECCSVQNYVRRMPYWHDWDGSFPSQTIIPLVGIILLFAFGVNESWKKHKITGITPILLGTTYLLFNALFRNSGGRYILPVDWTGVVYFSIGLAYMSTVVIENLTPDKATENSLIDPDIYKELKQKNFPRYAIYLAALGLFILGCTIPIFEASLPQRYTPARQDALQTTFFQSDLITDAEKNNIKTFLSQGGRIITGRGIYPRYFPANVGEPGKKKGVLGPQPYPRLVFHVVGPASPKIALPLASKPAFFPNASDVLVIGCPDQEAVAVAVYNSSGTPEAIYWRSPMPTELTCPLPVEQTEN
jgi:hypothetical protein